MARLPRYVIPGQPQHVILRGNNRSDIFQAEADYRFFLEKLKLACERHGADVHAYVLMTNHLHLLITPHWEDSLSKTMQTLGRYYVQYYNFSYQRSGTLWEGRYKATLIDSETYLFTCMRYIELNPVRAGMISHPSEYRWSSYHCNAQDALDPVVTPHAEYERLGHSIEARRAAYRQLFKHRIPERTLVEIRDATNKAWALGDEGFKHRTERRLARPVSLRARGGDRKSEAYRARSGKIG